MASSGGSPAIRLTALDGLRGIAAFVVASMHVEIFLSHGPSAIPRAHLAVDFFFLLSGFVLAMAYDPRFASGLSAGRFLTRRVLRLAPLYWTGCGIGAFALFAQAGVNWPAAAASLGLNLAFLPSWFAFSLDAFPVNMPGWSLFFELVVANSLFALFWGRLQGRTLIILNVLALLVLLHVIRTRGHLSFGYRREDFSLGFVRVLFSFFVGVQLYRLRERLPHVRLPALALAVVLALSFMVPLTGRAGRAYEAACVVVLFPAIVHLGSQARELSPRVGYVLGETSYALYALHVPLLLSPPVQAVTERLWPDGAGWHTWFQVPATAFLALISWALVQVIDLPAQRVIARRYRRERTAAPAPAPAAG